MQQGVLVVSRRADAGRAGMRGTDVRGALAAAGVPDPQVHVDDSLVLVTWGGLEPAAPDLWLLSGSPRAHERDLTPADVATMLGRRDAAALAQVLPPFAALLRSGPEEALAATDALGFRHLYHSSGTGWAALSTSARVLAVLGGRPLDREAISLQSLLGWQVGSSTLFDGVVKLQAGATARLAGGEVRITDPGPAPVEPLSLDEAVERAAAMLRRHLTSYVSDHPDATLQLTGGQDSRILMSAIPPQLRRGLTAVTLSVPGSEDVGIAAAICGATGTTHRVEALADLESLSPAEAYVECAEASLRLEGMADPVALAALTLAERRLDQGHRIAGLGGEVARGFYYLGRPRDPGVTRARVARLASWRMFANEAVDPCVVSADLRAAARERAVDRIHELMVATGKDWLAATDDFYLHQRMQRWAGITDTAVCLDRSVVNPMLDDRFVAIAQGMGPESKRGSLFLARLQMALDPRLGRMPLDGRPPPEAYATPGAANRVRAARTLAGKAVRKARQRTTGSTRPPAGGTVLAGKVVEHWRHHPALLDGAREHGILDETWVDALVAGRVTPAPSAVAFVLNVAQLPERHVRVPG